MNNKGWNNSSKDYNLLDIKKIQCPVLVLHKKYISIIHIQDIIKQKIDFEPTKQLKITLNDDFVNYDCLKNNLIMKYKNTFQTKIYFIEPEEIDPADIKSWIDFILANFNMTSFHLKIFLFDLTKSECIMKILKQNSLKHVCCFMD